jgi:hypothetical protein
MDMKTWTDRLGHSGLLSFTDADGHLWLEQKPAKASNTGRMLIDRLRPVPPLATAMRV